MNKLLEDRRIELEADLAMCIVELCNVPLGSSDMAEVLIVAMARQNELDEVNRLERMANEFESMANISCRN